VARLLATAEAGPLDGFQRARAALLRGHAAVVSAYGNEAAPLLLEAARRLEPFDLSLARRAYLTAWSAAITAHHLGGADVLVEICRAVRALPPLPRTRIHSTWCSRLRRVDHRRARGRHARSSSARRRRSCSCRWRTSCGGVGRSRGARSATWDDDAIAIYERQAQLVRDAGALGELPIHLQALALERAWRATCPARDG
jgi:hypothetical protein